MSYKVRNLRFAGMKMVISTEGEKEFDSEGVVEIESEELYNEMLTMKGFYAVESPKPDGDNDPKDNDPPKDDEPPKDQNPPEAPKADPKDNKDAKKDTKDNKASK